MKHPVLSRRQFLYRTSTGAALAGVASGSTAAPWNFELSFASWSPAPAQSSASASPTSGLVDLSTLKSLRIWDGHTHILSFNDIGPESEGSTPAERMENNLRYADRMGIERMCVFLGMELKIHAGPEAMRQQNDEVMEAVKHSNGRALGYAFMDPYYVDDCLDELNRCIRDGPMVGLKFEYDTPTLANSPEVNSIIERAGELKAVVIHHTWIKTTGNEVGESTPVQLAELARRHPSVTIICAHTGGNWELGIHAIRDVKNLYADLGGCDPTSGFTEMAVRELGPERVMYGSDICGRSFASQLAKVMGANIPLSARPLIMGENLRRVLRPILNAKGIKV